MFSRTRRTVGPSDQRAKEAIEFHDDQVGMPCQVRVVTRGLALILALILAGLVHLTQSSPTPVAFALCDKFNIRVQALVCSGDARTYYACNADGVSIAVG